MVAMPDGSFLTKEEWDDLYKEKESNVSEEMKNASCRELAEEFVDTIMAGCHHETTGDFDSRGFCRNKSIEIMNELVARRIMVSSSKAVTKE